jgi:hypothetical protein
VYAIQDRLGGAHFFYSVEETLPLSLEDVPLYVREAMWFSHDGASPHFARCLRIWLDNNFPDRWI